MSCASFPCYWKWLPSDLFYPNNFLGPNPWSKSRILLTPPSLTPVAHNTVDCAFIFPSLLTSKTVLFYFHYYPSWWVLLSLSSFFWFFFLPTRNLSIPEELFLFLNDMGKLISKPQYSNWKKGIKISIYLFLWKLSKLIT